MLTLGEKVRRMRLKRRLTLAQLAALTKVSSVTIFNIERNIYEPKISTLNDLCRALGTPLGYFTGPGGEGLFIRERDGEISRHHAGRLKSRGLPQLRSISMQAERELILDDTSGVFAAFHLVFGQVEAVMGTRSIRLFPGDTLYAELFEELKLKARGDSLGVMIQYGEVRQRV